MLSQHGIDPDSDLVVRGLGPDYPRQLELFESGEISALLSPEPNGTIGEARGLVSVWGDVLSLADVPQLQWSIQVANDDFLRDHPNIVRRFLKTTQRAARYLHDHVDEAIAFNEKLFNLPHDLAVKSATRERPTLHFDGQLDHSGLKRAIELQHRLGAIDEVKSLTAFVAKGFQPLPRH
jgi:ABC-type nitrate/sulfonate/bicarbonate transport system substrate-binding protein